jgi:hypothetical protein
MAAAATAIVGASYSGISTHGDYEVDEIQPQCANGATSCASPSSVIFELSPRAHESLKCEFIDGVGQTFTFGVGGSGIPLDDRSFAVTDVFRAGVKIAISGTFTSTTHVQGKITGLRVCGSDTYSFSIPLSALPCTLLTQAGAAGLSLGLRSQPATNTLTSSVGVCTQGFGNYEGIPGEGLAGANLDFYIYPSLKALESSVLFGPPTGTPVSGLGPKALFDFSDLNDGGNQNMTVVFHRSATWAAVRFLVTPKETGSCSATTPCAYPSPGRAAAETRLLSIARKVYPSLVG